MKIAVCIKQVVTREWQLRVNEAGTWIRDTRRQFRAERTGRLRARRGAASEGEARRRGGRLFRRVRLARHRSSARRSHGAPIAPIHVESDALVAADAFTVADALAAAIRDEKFDLVLTGLQSDDQGFGQVGVVLAEKLGMPHATIIMEVQVAPSTASGQASLRVKRELEGGWFQWMTLPLPALLTIQSGINQLRYATLKGIMAAKKKEIRKVTPQARRRSHAQRIHRVYFPEKGKKTQMIAGSAADAAKELVEQASRRREGDLVMMLVIAEQRDGQAEPRIVGNDCGRSAGWRTGQGRGARIECGGRGQRGRGGRRRRSRSRSRAPRWNTTRPTGTSWRLPHSSRPSSRRWCFCRTPTRPATLRQPWRRGLDARS